MTLKTKRKEKPLQRYLSIWIACQFVLCGLKQKIKLHFRAYTMSKQIRILQILPLSLFVFSVFPRGIFPFSSFASFQLSKHHEGFNSSTRASLSRWCFRWSGKKKKPLNQTFHAWKTQEKLAWKYFYPSRNVEIFKLLAETAEIVYDGANANEKIWRAGRKGWFIWFHEC